MNRITIEKFKFLFRKPIIFIRKKANLIKTKRIIRHIKKTDDIDWSNANALLRADPDESKLVHDTTTFEEELDRIWNSDDFTDLEEDDEEPEDSTEDETTPTKPNFINNTKEIGFQASCTED